MPISSKQSSPWLRPTQNCQGTAPSSTPILSLRPALGGIQPANFCFSVLPFLGGFMSASSLPQAGCSRRPQFDSWHLHGGSQLSVTTVWRYRTRSSLASTGTTCTYRQNTHTHLKHFFFIVQHLSTAQERPACFLLNLGKLLASLKNSGCPKTTLHNVGICQEFGRRNLPLATVLLTLAAYSFKRKAQANIPCLLPRGVEARLMLWQGLCQHASCRQAEERPVFSDLAPLSSGLWEEG